MATLLVRKLDEDVVRRLKERAKRHGRSTEAEHRAILDEALSKPVPAMSGAELLARLRRCGTAELDIPKDDEIEPARFD